MIASVAIFAAILAEAFFIYCMSETFASGYANHQRSLPATSYIAVACLAFYMPSILSFFNFRGRTATAIAAVSAYVIVYGLLRIEFGGDFRLWDFNWIPRFLEDEETTRRLAGPVFATSFLLLALWVRCTLRSRAELDAETLPKTLVVGFIVVTLLVVLGAATDRSGEIGRAAAAFYALALIALALAQLSMSGATFGDARAGGIVGLLMGGVVAVTIVGVLVFSLIFGVFGDTIGAPIGKAIGWTLAAILTPPVWLLSKFFQLILGGGGIPPVTSSALDYTSGAEAGPAEPPSGAERTLVFGARTLALVVFLGVLIVPAWLLWALRGRARSRSISDASSVSSGSLVDDLRSLFSRRGNTRVRGEPRDPIGHLYSDVLHRAETQGREREPSETPQEFAEVLTSRLHLPVAGEITFAFEQARYGGREPTPDEVNELEQRWRREKS